VEHAKEVDAPDGELDLEPGVTDATSAPGTMTLSQGGIFAPARPPALVTVEISSRMETQY
jgi:hypothetical protein